MLRCLLPMSINLLLEWSLRFESASCIPGLKLRSRVFFKAWVHRNNLHIITSWFSAITFLEGRKMCGLSGLFFSNSVLLKISWVVQAVDLRYLLWWHEWRFARVFGSLIAVRAPRFGEDCWVDLGLGFQHFCKSDCFNLNWSRILNNYK